MLRGQAASVNHSPSGSAFSNRLGDPPAWRCSYRGAAAAMQPPLLPVGMAPMRMGGMAPCVHVSSGRMSVNSVAGARRRAPPPLCAIKGFGKVDTQKNQCPCGSGNDYAVRGGKRQHPHV